MKVPGTALERSLVAAAALHGLAVLWTGHLRPSPRDALAPPTLPAAEPTTLDVEIGEVDVVREATPPQTPPPPTPEAAPTVATRVAALTTSRDAPIVGGIEGVSGAGSASPASAAPTGSAGNAGPPTGGPLGPPLSLAQLGLSGPNRYMGTARESEAPPDTRAITERALAEPLHQRDVALGLGASGPVVHALEDATGGGLAPVNSRAVFLATTDSAGNVTSLRVLEVSEDRRSWDEIASQAEAALRGKKLRVPSRSKGVAMRVEVVSRWALPSGRDPGVTSSIFGLPLTQGAGKQSTRVEILNPIPKITRADTPNPDTASGVKLPAHQVQMTILGIAGDPSDIGAKPRRVVRAHVLDETSL